jgi:hypothetical protein
MPSARIRAHFLDLEREWMPGTYSSLRYAVGAFPDKEGSEWRWFVVGVDSLEQHQYFNVSIGHYLTEDLAFDAGRVALKTLRTGAIQTQTPSCPSKEAVDIAARLLATKATRKARNSNG